MASPSSIPARDQQMVANIVELYQESASSILFP